MAIIGLLLLLAAGSGLFLAVITLHTAWILTHPPRRTYAWALARSLPATPAEIVSSEPVTYSEWQAGAPGEPLPVWDIRGRDPRGPVVVFTHGWGESRIASLTRIAAILPACSRVLAWDLPGHGDARGACRLGTSEDMELMSIIRSLGEPAAPLVLFGSSLGAGVSIVAAARIAGDPALSASLAAVIVEAPYRLPWTPARNVLRNAGFPHRFNLPVAMLAVGAILGRGLSWRASRHADAAGFDRTAHAARVKVPLVVLHGTLDEVCPIADGLAIAAAAPAGRLAAIEGGGHMNLWTQEPYASRSAAEVLALLRSLRTG